jgi:2-phosphosulfolactate phosphatase
MPTKIEVLCAPAEQAFLDQREHFGETVCVVFDILRMTSSIVTALENGAEAILPVGDIADALAEKDRRPEVLLAGERGGMRIDGNLTGGIAFDFGNSPREFTRRKVRGKTIVMTTTNGTRALLACAKAKKVLIASFLNLRATADFIARLHPPQLLLVCSGTLDQAAYEDVLGAGALCDLIWPQYAHGEVADSATIACQLFRREQGNVPAALEQSRNGLRLLRHRKLRDDVPFCSQRDTLKLVAKLDKDGLIRRRN